MLQVVYGHSRIVAPRGWVPRLQKEAATCFHRFMLFEPDFRESEEARCRAHIERGLQGAAVPEKLVRDLAGAMMEEHAVWYTEGASSPDFLSLVRQSRGWAVRDCDFDFVANLVNGPLLGLGTGAATAAVTGSTLLAAGTSAVVQVVHALYKTHIAAKRKGATIGARKAALLAALKEINNGDGATLQEVAAHVAERFPRLPYTTDEVRSDLEALKTVTTDGTGEVVAFTFTVDGDDTLWKTSC